jgi:hypothetical protein
MSMSEKPSLTAVRVWLSSDDFLLLAEVFKSLPGTPATTLLAPVGQRVGGSPLLSPEALQRPRRLPPLYVANGHHPARQDLGQAGRRRIRDARRQVVARYLRRAPQQHTRSTSDPPGTLLPGLSRAGRDASPPGRERRPFAPCWLPRRDDGALRGYLAGDGQQAQTVDLGHPKVREERVERLGLQPPCGLRARCARARVVVPSGINVSAVPARGRARGCRDGTASEGTGRRRSPSRPSRSRARCTPSS